MNERIIKLNELRIKSLCKSFKCPICQRESEFDFETGEFQVIGFEREGDSIVADAPASYIPTIVNVCPHCGFTAHFNLKETGLE